MQQIRLPEHPAAQEEYLHLQQVRDAIEREISEVEALTGAKAGVVMDVRMKEVRTSRKRSLCSCSRASWTGCGS